MRSSAGMEVWRFAGLEIWRSGGIDRCMLMCRCVAQCHGVSRNVAQCRVVS